MQMCIRDSGSTELSFGKDKVQFFNQPFVGFKNFLIFRNHGCQFVENSSRFILFLNLQQLSLIHI